MIAPDWQPPAGLYFGLIVAVAFCALTVMARRHRRGAPSDADAGPFPLLQRLSSRIGYALLLFALAWIGWEAVAGFVPGIGAFHWPLLAGLLLVLAPAALRSEHGFRARRREAEPAEPAAPAHHPDLMRLARRARR